MKIFCDRLKETRGGTSQKAFAAMLGLNQQTYQRYETGVREPDLEHLHQIGVVCGVSIDWLLGLPERGGSSTMVSGNTGIIGAVGTNARATVRVKSAAPNDCANCKYKRLADAFKAL